LIAPSRTAFARRLLLVVILLGAAACSSTSASTGADSLIGRPAPPLSGVDLTGTGVTQLAELSGKPTAVVFWLNTCPHCQNELPRVEAAWPALSGKANVLTVGMLNPSVAAEPPYDTTAGFVAASGLTMPTIDVAWADVADAWGLQGVPTTFVLDSAHVVRHVYLGEGNLEAIAHDLEALAGR
jgi:cytochrome oxidase Cu insertion factor (SCO1/SenC/PrrC family)